MSDKIPYWQRLQDPRWQKKRLEVLQRASFTCEECRDESSTLHVHHRYYVDGRLPWEYPDFCFQALCRTCHEGKKTAPENHRLEGSCMFEDWEAGLDYFGDKIFDMFANEEIGKNFAEAHNISTPEVV